MAQRILFRFQGQLIATNTPTQWVFLFGDHLGSVSTVAAANGAVPNTQDFDPWGRSAVAARHRRA